MVVKKYMDKEYGGSNTYVCIENDTAIIIDAGVSIDLIKEDLKGITVEGIFITHAHFDHIYYLEEYIREFDTQLYISDIGYMKLYSAEKNMSLWFNEQLIKERSADEDEETEYQGIVLKDKYQYTPLTENSVFYLKNFVVKAVFTPGHSSDSYTFIIDNNAFVGDLIFKAGVGRTDFYDGDSKALVQSIMKLRDYKEIRNIHSGHGESTSLLK